jgi:probable rRNA maturation factor
MPLHVRVQTNTARLRGPAPGRTLIAAARRGVRATLAREHIGSADISVTLAGDADMARLNRRWRGHAGPTDVLAFPLYADDEAPVGDLYIGVEQARRQAKQYNVRVSEEVARLAIHGTLHVLGYDHPEGAGRRKSAMWRIQEQILTEVMKP